jgi:hypothetical protein
MLRFIIVLSLLFSFADKLQAQEAWSNFIDSVSTLSSPRAIDLNNDGIKDIVVGSGTDSTFSNYGVVAFDGSNGDLLWSLPTTDEVFTSAIFNDINNDQIPDVFIGGRNAQLYAIDGSNGDVIWEYFPQNSDLNPADSGLYNFYSSQFLEDQNGDSVLDILVTNGGDQSAGPFDPRPAGNLMLISGLDGSKISIAESPDGAEIYCSPILIDHGNSNSPYIIFGTGGEQNAGSMFVTTLTALLNNDISEAIVLDSHPSKGFIAPASTADLNNDSFSDIIIQSFDGVIQAFDGLTFELIWANTFLGCESSSAPTIGNFTGGDLVPDVFNVLYKGTTPTYFDYYQVMIDGASGELIFFDSIASMQFPSSTAFDANGDGRDEVLISVNDISSYFTNQLKLIDFQNDTLIDITNSQPGVNLACTPLIDDLDQDGKIEFIYTSKKDSLNPSAWKGFNIYRYNTDYDVPLRGIAWGAYMGTHFTGHYNNLLSICPNHSIIDSWTVSQPSCNQFSDGNISPIQINVNPNSFLWSNGTTSDTLNNLSAGNYQVYLTDSNNCLEIHNFQLYDPYNVTFGNIVHNNCVGDSTGRVTVSSSGCICQFSTCAYTWSNGSLIKHATQLPAGYHSVELIHSDGCVVIDSIIINDGFPVIDSFQTNHLSCFNLHDGSISLFPYDEDFTTYSWSNNDTSSLNNLLSAGDYSVIVNNNYCYDSLSFTISSPDTISFNTEIQHLDCLQDSSGSIEFFTDVINYPYQFYLNSEVSQEPNFSNLISGSYQLFVQDTTNCFSDTINVTLLQSDSLFLNFENVVDNNCVGDSIAEVIVLSNGCGCDTCNCIYSWSNGSEIEIASNLSEGFYIVEVNHDNLCTLRDSIYVSDGLPVLDSFLVENISCSYINDGIITLYPSDTISNSYIWSNGSTLAINDLLNPGIYHVTITNTFCSDSTSFSLNPVDSVSLSSTFINLDCFQDSSGLIEIIPSGNNYPYLYHINNIFSQDSIFGNLSFGTYQLFVEDASNCYSDTIEVFLSQPEQLDLSFDVTPVSQPGYLDGAINSSVSGGTLPYNYNWGHLPGIDESSATYLSEGMYNLQVTDDNGCEIIDSTSVGLISSAIEIITNNLNIYPIPSYGKVIINNNSNSLFNYSIYDLNGKLIDQLQSISANEVQSIQLNPGNYILQAFSKDVIFNKNIVVY